MAENDIILNREHEKRTAALSSIIAAVLLVAMKIGVGIWTGSLGILAEAAHSGLDLAAAFMTFLAVRISDRPADKSHLYGHGKVENLSAFIETILLMVTCIWIVYEAVNRLFFKTVELEVTVWAFAVMGVSIIVDFSRSRVLYRAAKKYNSQALEADALHFSTDIWSSAVVILGLILVKLSEVFPGLQFLKTADAVAAVAVALIVVFVSIRLGIRTVHALTDAAPKGVMEQIVKEVESINDVVDCHNVRIRHSGPHLFIDVHILVDGKKSLNDVHKLTDEIEKKLAEKIPEVDVTVHPEPRP